MSPGSHGKFSPCHLIRFPWLLATRRQPAQSVAQQQPVLSPPVDPEPSPGSVDAPLSYLLKLLRNKKNRTRSVTETLGLLLGADDFVDIVNKIDNQQDAEIFIEMLINLFDNDLINQIGVINGNTRARRLITKISAKLSMAPKFLFLNPSDIIIPSILPIGGGSLANVYKGTYRGTWVALKRVNSGKIDKSFLQEAMAWRTLSHKFILPFIGIFVDHSRSFVSLVSPFMKNGTLRDWRYKMKPPMEEVKKRIREVAEGLAYLHTEGIVHGDLKGSNVLLDHEFHVKISDFGSAKHLDSTATKTWGTTLRFAAPELFCDEGLYKRTQETDVYAFGCLYYEIQFGILPFGDMDDFNIRARVKHGRRPALPLQPQLDDHGVKLINQSWDQNPCQRPRIKDVLNNWPT